VAGAAEVVEAALVVVLETAAAEALAAVEEALAVAALVAVALEAAKAALSAAGKDTPRPCPDRICHMALVEALVAAALAAVAARHHLHRDRAVHTRAIDRLQAARAPPGPRRPSQNARRTWSSWGGR